MNLIEQLDGYVQAKEKINQNIKDFGEECGEVGIYHPNAGWIVHEDLQSCLLEYRRENNIFEVGDYYAYLYEWDSDLDIICKYNPSEWSDHLWNIENMIRHATDEEIKVGHRI